MGHFEKIPLLENGSKLSFESNKLNNSSTSKENNSNSTKQKYFDAKILDKLFFFWVNKIVEVKIAFYSVFYHFRKLKSKNFVKRIIMSSIKMMIVNGLEKNLSRNGINPKQRVFLCFEPKSKRFFLCFCSH